MIPLGFTGSGKVKEYPERQWLHNYMQMAKTHDKKCPPQSNKYMQKFSTTNGRDVEYILMTKSILMQIAIISFSK